MKLNNLTKIFLLILAIFSIAVVYPIVVFSEETVPLINEVMSSNQTTIQDEDGDYHKMENNARELHAHEFNWEHQERKLFEIYNSHGSVLHARCNMGEPPVNNRL